MLETLSKDEKLIIFSLLEKVMDADDEQHPSEEA